MRILMLLLLPLLILGGSCAREARAQDPYRWLPIAGHPDQEALYLGGQQVGVWRYDLDAYYPCWGGGWGPACQPPCQPPVRNYGLGLDGVRRDACFSEHERTTINGREITLEHARQLLVEASGAGTIPDDRGKAFAVAVGSEVQCQMALATLATLPAASALRVQCYRPEDAMTRDRDGKVMYRPGITLVSAGGSVAGHTDSFDAAEDLQEGLRRLDPKTDPATFPSLKNRVLGAALGPLVPPLALLGGGGVLLAGAGLVHLSRRRVPSPPRR